MEVKLLDLTRQYKMLHKELEPAILQVTQSGNYIGGDTVEEFERIFAKYIGVKHAISVNSGTDALIIALRAAQIKAGDEVITTPFTFFATAEAIACVKAVPVFVDIEENTFNIDADKIEEKITARTKAILPVHIFGHPADMNKINRIADKYDLKVIEDACQAVGSAISGRKAGSLGTAGCFSFFPTKNLGAFGDGGMITTNQEMIAVIAKGIREHGSGNNGARAYELLNIESTEIVTSEKPAELYSPEKYYNYLIGANSRLDALQAAILNVKIKYLDEFNLKRIKIADNYDKGLHEIKNIVLSKKYPEVYHVRHQYAFRCKEKYELIAYLRQHKIGVASFYPTPLHLQKALTYLDYQNGDFPVSEKMADETVCLPIYPELTEKEQAYIIKTINDFYHNR